MDIDAKILRKILANHGRYTKDMTPQQNRVYPTSDILI